MTAQVLNLDRWLLDDEPAQWAAGFVDKLAAGTAVPVYGSPEWQAADWQVQVASAVRAAEAWRRESLYLPQSLEDELAARRALLDHADALAFADLAGRVVAFDDLARRAASLAKSPTLHELVERRAA
jgi:hypothetical protein